MQVLVQGLSGIVVVVMNKTSLVRELKTLIATKEKMNGCEGMLLMSGGKQLEDEKTLEECGIGEASIVRMTMKILGGGLDDTLKNLSDAIEEQSRLLDQLKEALGKNN